MKKILLLLLLASAFSADAQTLKELLYSGKLKKDSSTVIRKTDDLSTKIDTVQKKEPAASAVVARKEASDSIADGKVSAELTVVEDSAAVSEENEAAESEPVADAAVKTAPAKSNTKIWKEYTDSLSIEMKETISNKKVKKGSYFFYVEYEIDEAAQVSVNKVTVSPENEFLLNHVRERLLTVPPQLAPVLDSSNQPKKVKRRQSFTIVKD